MKNFFLDFVGAVAILGLLYAALWLPYLFGG